jgi:energy-coupling factor transporter ATP-binding protein EcfA2
LENTETIVEVVSGGIANRNDVSSIDIYSKMEKQNAWQGEMYRSHYSFDETFYDFVKSNKTVKGFDGLCYVDRIIVDIDRGDIEESSFQNYVINCIDELIDKGVYNDDINIWFSGTGYHIELLNVFGFQPSKNVHDKVKCTMAEHFSFGDTIYDKTRIIRSNWSLNKKTNLFKVWIPLPLIYELTFDKVKEIARSRENYLSFMSTHNYGFETLNLEKSVEPYLQSMIVASPTITVNGNSKKGDVSSVVSCMQHVFNEGPIKGSRNMKLMRMASSYKRAGIPYLVTLNGMISWSNGSLSNEEIARSVTNVYEQNYQYGCNDTIMSEYCDPKCIYFQRKDYTLDIKDITQLQDSFRDLVLKDLSKKSINLADIWNTNKFSISPGELVVFSGDTGMGKTAFVQNLVTKAKKDTLFLSLEMDEALIFRRFVQVAANQTKEWVYNQFKSNPDIDFEESLGHVKIMTIAPTLDAIKKVVAQNEPNVLVIDTTDELQVPGFKGIIEEQNAIIDTLKQIAQKNHTIVFAIHHINKASASNNNISLHSLKGSSNVVQKADKVIIIKGDESEKHRVIHSVKSRDEDKLELICHFNYETMSFEQLKMENIYDGTS